MTPTNKMENRIDMSARVDERKWAVQLMARVWVILVITIVGAVAGGLFYLIYTTITNGDTKYQRCTDFYITFNEREYPNGMDYYNAYTWNQFIKDDRITDCALENLGGNLDKETVKQCVSSVMLGDYRVLTLSVVSTEPGYVDAITEAYKVALPNFAASIPEISSIELWSCDEMTELRENTRMPNAALLGGIVAFVLACIGFAIYYALDDRIYTQTDVKGYLKDITFIGYKTESLDKEYEANLKKVTDGKKVEIIIASSNLAPASKSCIIEIPMGKVRATQLLRRVDFLTTQECKICGVVITECDSKFLKRYYK